MGGENEPADHIGNAGLIGQTHPSVLLMKQRFPHDGQVHSSFCP
jgi:hypothetical protein